MTHSFLKRLLAAAVVAAALLMLPDASPAQQPNDPWAQVKQDARTSESNQRSPDVQARIQRWFVAKIEAYQKVLDNTALGKANPKIINLGDFSRHLRALLAPPTGTGTAVVLFTDEVGTASTMEDTMDILFPQRSADTYIDLHHNTCWHEFQHSITMVSERNGRSVACQLDDWRIWRKPPIDDVAEHIYIESLGEYTVEWLDFLLPETSALTGGPALGFEKHCRDAYEQMKQYQARSESVSYAVENFCWAKAHEAWIRGWKLAQKIAPMPRNLREDYRDINGVWIGFVEDVIKFYMEGGLTAKDGKKIRVPEWVMWPDPMKSGIIIGHLDEKTEIQGNTLKCGFDVRVLETYRRKERSDSLNHGAVGITLENPDGDSRLELAVDGQPAKPDASGKIDLTPFKWDSKIRVTLVRGNLSKLAGKKRYKVLVDYKDTPRTVNGAKQPSFYYDSRAIYYIDVTGTANTAAAPSAPAKPAGGKPSAAAPKAPAAGKASGRWVLVDTSATKRVDDLYKTQKRFSFSANVELTGVDFETVYTDEDSPKRSYTERSKHTWNHPGQTLTPGSTVEVTMTAADAGSSNLDSKRGINAFTTLRAMAQEKGSSFGFGLFANPHHGGRDTGGGGVSIATGSPAQSQTYTSKIPIREAAPGSKLTITMESSQGPNMAEVKFNYQYEAGPVVPVAEKPKVAQAVLVAEEPDPQPEEEPMDNDPPAPGEVIKVKPVTEDPPPAKRPAPDPGRWFTHAAGCYKFKLSPGWEVSAKHLFADADDGYDTIWSPERDMVIICARDYSDDYSDAAVQAAVKLTLKDSPGATVKPVKYGGVTAQVISDYSKADEVMSWQVIFQHNKRGYLISANMPAEAPPAKMPEPISWMLGSLVMLK